MKPASVAFLVLAPFVTATAVYAAAPTGLCKVLGAGDLTALFGPAWTLASAEPAGGPNTCYYTLKSGGKTQLVGVKVDPANAYDLVVQFLASPKPVTGLGDKAVVGRSGGAATYVISANGKTISTTGGQSEEQSRKLAELIVSRRP